MISLDEMRESLVAGNFELSRHAFKRVVERNISEQEIREAGRHAIMIEDYPEDKFTPSCLLLRFAESGRPLHLQVSYVDIHMLKIITLYEPDPAEWYDHRRRR